ncbi:MFS transporter [Mesorhizobium sp. L-8-10]|uniref:MFS transporter n=1 Tax=Mesorhizobium sp. L-8-10 TaxID=2744523 RepID=UPI001929309D|nr:MFS transporter [Mesorhizobium sp. L-8-10]BCH29550.1 MFS transporter [Mesorhizobium sp. L-8-10]
MDASIRLASAVRGRWAVAAMFFVNGFVTGSWAPQIPVFLTRLQISEFTLGLLILLFGLGALIAMPVSGYLMSRHGSGNVTLGFGCVVVVALLLVVLAPNVPVAALAMLVFGGSIGAMDVAMNANAVAVEKKLSRAVMSSSHGFWSLGGFAGGGLGGFAIQSYGSLPHAAVVSLIAAAILAVAARHVVTEDKPVAHEHHKFALPKTATVYLVGLMALFSMVPEGAVLDWAALYMKQELGTDLATAGLAYAFFSGAMALMRFAGDGVRNRFGAVNTLRISSLVAASGMLVGALSPWPALAIAAFAVCGLGIANVVPIIFSAGGNQPGMASSVGMSVVTTMGYSGILLAPSAIGFAAEHAGGFSPVFITLSGLLIVVCLMGRLVHAADFRR